MMSATSLKRAMPNEQGEMVLEFDHAEFRLFKVFTLYQEKGWHKLAYPQHVKRFVVSENGIDWAEGGFADAGYLYEKSTPITARDLERQSIRLSYKNQAPTSEDKLHHVYGVYLAPFSAKPFQLVESIGGGMADRGGGTEKSLAELLVWNGWKGFFKLSGCSWAAALIGAHAKEPALLSAALIAEACRRNGTAEA